MLRFVRRVQHASGDGAAVSESVTRATRSVLGRVVAALRRRGERGDGAAGEAAEEAESVRKHLDDVFRMVVVGEFNAGKSSFINALVGKKVVAEGVTPTTHQINILEYGKPPSGPITVEMDTTLTKLDVEWLRGVSIVDTPGTNAVVEKHDSIARHFVPRADTVLFLTTFDKSISHSEREFLTDIAQWGKKIVAVVNKIDIVDAGEPGEVDAVLAFVESSLRDVLPDKNAAPLPMFAVSARRALVQPGSDPGFNSLHAYIHELLESDERRVIKLEAPLAVAARVTAAAAATAEAEVTAAAARLDVVTAVAGEVDEHVADCDIRVEAVVARVGKSLYAVRDQIRDVISANFTYGSLFKALVAPHTVAATFEAQFVASVDGEVYQDAKRGLGSLRAAHAEFLSGYAEKLQRLAPDVAPRRVPNISSASAEAEVARSVAQAATAPLQVALRGATLASRLRASFSTLLVVEGSLAGAGTLASIASDMVLIPWVGTAALMTAALGLVPLQRAATIKSLHDALAFGVKAAEARMRAAVEADVDDVRAAAASVASPVVEAAQSAARNAARDLAELDEIGASTRCGA
ncbi:dynamin family protein [Thecamonas trahens ATCC 50062]|uniref:Dynamin family protein n=1 Tax=Thecamonas trahens ATCC 50062 TaxID=461836 RepID=A0A0L0D128_THETB|nr:dynamin family protein [Thecamonas trahens ATCC 50062]KNC45947.1 dynamin family protein [Thecamonas trahens ATCC 50062]|eukprot:XP_013762930.1 dynamin family protein [Thecamonas trahens ATCC 50062]